MVKAQTKRRYSEGEVARTIEDQTAELPSDLFLWAAGAAAGTSMLLRLMGRHGASTFIGQWVPSILICGVYNKIVKTHGHDAMDNDETRYDPRAVGDEQAS
jgi:hypothetical protein